MAIPAVRGGFSAPQEKGFDLFAGMSTAKKVGMAVGSAFVGIAAVTVGLSFVSVALSVGVVVLAATIVFGVPVMALWGTGMGIAATKRAVESFFDERAAAKREQAEMSSSPSFSASISSLGSLPSTLPLLRDSESDVSDPLSPDPVVEDPAPFVEQPVPEEVAAPVVFPAAAEVAAPPEALPAAEVIAPLVALVANPVEEALAEEIPEAPLEGPRQENPVRKEELIVRPDIGERLAETALRTALCGVLISGIGLYHGARGAAWTGRTALWAGRTVVVDAPIAAFGVTARVGQAAISGTATAGRAVMSTAVATGQAAATGVATAGRGALWAGRVVLIDTPSAALGVTARAGQAALSGAAWVGSGMAAGAAAIGSAALSGATWVAQTTSDAASLMDG